MTIAGTWQGLMDQMSLKPRDLRKKCAGSRDSDHTTKNYWESGLGLFTIAFSGDFDPKKMSESAPRGPTRSAPALTSDCSVSLYQPRTLLIVRILNLLVLEYSCTRVLEYSSTSTVRILYSSTRYHYYYHWRAVSATRRGDCRS